MHLWSGDWYLFKCSSTAPLFISTNGMALVQSKHLQKYSDELSENYCMHACNIYLSISFLAYFTIFYLLIVAVCTGWKRSEPSVSYTVISTLFANLPVNPLLFFHRSDDLYPHVSKPLNLTSLSSCHLSSITKYFNAGWQVAGAVTGLEAVYILDTLLIHHGAYTRTNRPAVFECIGSHYYYDYWMRVFS